MVALSKVFNKLDPRYWVIQAGRAMVPAISENEKLALKSGTVGWDGQLMGGHPDFKVLAKINKPELTEEEQAFLNGPVEQLCKMLNDWKIQQDGDMPKEVWDFIKTNGFMGLEIPKEYGGKGFSSQLHSATVMKIASRSTTASVSVMVPNSLGPAELIKKYGTQTQKDYYLPRLAKGTEVPCFALTESDAGSDANGLSSRGIICKNDKGEIGVRLNWEKRYITLGPIATLLGLAIQLEDPEGLIGDKKDLGITVVLVPSNAPGIEIGDRHKPMDIPFMNGPNTGKDVFIPIDNIIGGKDGAGQGWRMLMECLAVGRSLSLPAVSVSGAKLATYASGSYSRTRRQFGMPVSKFQGVEEVLGRMAGLTYMMNAARAATVQMVDQGERPTVASAILKYHLTENMRKIVNDAMDIHGGKAVSNGPNNILADIYKAIPIGITVEGANILTRNLMIGGQGLVRAHPYALKEMEALENPSYQKGFNQLVKAAIPHALNTVRNALRTVWYSVTGGIFAPGDSATRKYYKQISRLSAALALTSDLSIPLGGKMKSEQRYSARFGDVLSNLYLASTTLWWYEKQGRPKEDLPLVRWAVSHALHEAEEALGKALASYPTRALPWFLRPLIAPGVVLTRLATFVTGRHNKAPSDNMDKLAADCVRNPGVIRDKLAAGLFLPTSLDEPLGVLAQAFNKSVETEPLEKKIAIALKKGKLAEAPSRNALLESALANGIIQQADVDLLKETDVLRNAVIAVDAFPQAKAAPAAAAEKAKAVEGPKAA